MMKIFVSIFLVFCACQSGMAQKKEFIRQTKIFLQETDVLTEIELTNLSKQEFNPLNFKEVALENAVLSILKKNSKNKQFKLSKSLHLTAISQLSAKYFTNDYCNKSYQSYKKKLGRAQHASLSKFGLIEVLSFEIPLIKSKMGDFYFDKKGDDSNLNLYLNPVKLSKKEKLEGKEPEKKAVLLYTETEILNTMIEKIKKNKIFEGLKNGNYYATGISISVNSKTLHKRAIPMLRVVVAFGSKRLHLVQRKIEKDNKRKLPK